MQRVLLLLTDRQHTRLQAQQMPGLPVADAGKLVLDPQQSQVLRRLLSQPGQLRLSPDNMAQFSALLPGSLKSLFVGQHLMLRSIANQGHVAMLLVVDQGGHSTKPSCRLSAKPCNASSAPWAASPAAAAELSATIALFAAPESHHVRVRLPAPGDRARRTGQPPGCRRADTGRPEHCRPLCRRPYRRRALGRQQAHPAWPATGARPATAEVQQLENLFAELGHHPEAVYVVYDDEGGGWAGRFIWLLDVIGHHRYHFLNGGLQAWLADGLPVTQEVPAAAADAAVAAA